MDTITNDKIDITFENLTYSVSLGYRKGLKTILHDINGNFLAGQFIAIIGPSGAGKTSLLDILSGYQVSAIEGSICVNGVLRNLREFKKLSCYITYDNHLQPLLTVWENMSIAADLKLGFGISKQKKDCIIKDILSTLSLTLEVNTRAQYLSGGQQKRLSIALELISNPMIMFFDEPTTGLDSLSSHQCLKQLQRLALQGKTIICTIHQPSASVISLFDQIYVLGEGRCLYQGSPLNLVSFLNTVNLPCPKYHNPVDYVIELASGENKINNISNMMQEIKNGKCLMWMKNSKIDFVGSLLNQQTRQLGSIKNRISVFDQFKILVRRDFLKYRRDMKLTYMRLIVNILIGVLFGMAYWQSGVRGDKVRANYSLLFGILIHHMTSTIMISILTFPKEFSIICQEHFNRWYSLIAYFLSATISDIPILMLCCLVFTAIIYPCSGQPLEFQRIVMFTTVSILVVLVVQSCGLIIGSIFNVMNGTFVGFAFSATMMLLAGIGEGLKDLPINIHWISYSSYMKYGLEGILDSIYGFNRSPIDCPEDIYCHYKYPKKFLKDIMVEENTFWFDILGLLSMFVIFRICAFLVLKWKLTNSC